MKHFAYLSLILTRKCQKNAKELKSLDRIAEKDDSTKNSETELGVSDHVVAAANQELVHCRSKLLANLQKVAQKGTYKSCSLLAQKMLRLKNSVF